MLSVCCLGQLVGLHCVGRADPAWGTAGLRMCRDCPQHLEIEPSLLAWQLGRVGQAAERLALSSVCRLQHIVDEAIGLVPD